MVKFPPMQWTENDHTAFRDWVYDELEKEQARFDKYFSDDSDEEGEDEYEDDEFPF